MRLGHVMSCSDRPRLAASDICGRCVSSRFVPLQPLPFVFANVYMHVYISSPVRRFPIGKEELIKGWKTDDILEFHRKHYRPVCIVNRVFFHCW